MAKASSNYIMGLGRPLGWGQGRQPQHGKSQLQLHFGPGEAFGKGGGGPSVSFETR